MIIELTAENFEEEVTNFSGVVIIKASTPTCPPCKVLDPFFHSIADANTADDMKFCSVDCEDQPLVAEFLGVVGVPTLIGRNKLNGWLVDTKVRTEEALRSFIGRISR
jgi:thioredoxin-like negative regulator of GroEL